VAVFVLILEVVIVVVVVVVVVLVVVVVVVALRAFLAWGAAAPHSPYSGGGSQRLVLDKHYPEKA